MENYYRITAYHKESDVSAVFDAYGRYEKLWQFSAELIKYGFRIIKVNKADSFVPAMMDLLPAKTPKICLRAAAKGEPLLEPDTYEGKPCTMVIVGDKVYIPDFQN